MVRAQPKPKKITQCITIEDSIDYVALDPTPGGGNLGRAEFIFCPIWKDGIMTRLLIYPRQQRVKVFCYDLSLKDAGMVKNFCFHSWTHKGIEQPHAWRMYWCEEHATVSYEVYVPSKTNRLSFEPHFGDSIDIHFGIQGER